MGGNCKPGHEIANRTLELAGSETRMRRRAYPRARSNPETSEQHKTYLNSARPRTPFFVTNM